MSQFLKDLAVLLIRHSDPTSNNSGGPSQQASHVQQQIVAAVRSHPYHVTSLTAMVDPGRYSVVPFSLQLDQPLHIEILSEAPASAVQRTSIQHGWTTRELLVLMTRDQLRGTRLTTVASASSTSEYYFDGMLQMTGGYGFCDLLAKHHGLAICAPRQRCPLRHHASEGMTVAAAARVVVPPQCRSDCNWRNAKGQSRMLWSFQYQCRTMPKVEAVVLVHVQWAEKCLPHFRLFDARYLS